MTKINEQSFGARHLRMKELKQYVNEWDNYDPPRPEETVEELEKFLDNVAEVNMAETLNQGSYNTAVITRQELFKKKNGSIEKLLTQARGVVEANYGKTSIEAKQIAAIITEFRATKVIKLPANPANPDVERTVSQSQKGYGSVTKFFADTVGLISKMSNYKATNPALTVAGLQEKLGIVNKVNEQVATCLQVMRSSRNERLRLYKEMKERSDRIKSYAKGEYGTDSQEYRSIKGIRI